MTKRYLSNVSAVLSAALLLVTVSAARSDQPSTGAGSSNIAAVHSAAILGPAPSGLVVVLDTNSLNDTAWQKAVSNPYISGVAVQIRWSDIEPVQGKPDWSKLDELFAAAQSSKKWVHLLIFPGFFSPAWALVGAQTDQFPIQYGPGQGTVKELPMPWDPVYLNNWFTFVKQVADRYGRSPALRLVAADGPTSVSAEFTLPGTPKDLKQWQNDGFKPSKYLNAWKTTLQTYAADFPNQYVSISAGDGLNIDNAGKIDPSERTRIQQSIIADGMKSLGSRFAFQLSDVHAGTGPHGQDSSAEDQLVIQYNGSIVTGLQMRTSAENSSAVMGAAGDPALALRRSIDLALQPNGTGQHIDYLEIYSPDVLAADMQSVLKYGASAISAK